MVDVVHIDGEAMASMTLLASSADGEAIRMLRLGYIELSCIGIRH